MNGQSTSEAINKSAARAIPCVARLVFAAKRLDKFIEPRALPGEMGVGAMATDVRREMPQGNWSRRTVCKSVLKNSVCASARLHVANEDTVSVCAATQRNA